MSDLIFYERLMSDEVELNDLLSLAFRKLVTGSGDFILLTPSLIVNYQFFGHDSDKSHLFLCVKDVNWVDVGIIEMPTADYENEKKVINKMCNEFMQEEYYLEGLCIVKWISDNYKDYLEEECEE